MILVEVCSHILKALGAEYTATANGRQYNIHNMCGIQLRQPEMMNRYIKEPNLCPVIPKTQQSTQQEQKKEYIQLRTTDDKEQRNLVKKITNNSN